MRLTKKEIAEIRGYLHGLNLTMETRKIQQDYSLSNHTGSYHLYGSLSVAMLLHPL